MSDQDADPGASLTQAIRDKKNEQKRKTRIPDIEVEAHSMDFGFKPYTSMFEVEGKDEEYNYRNVMNTPQRMMYWQRLGYEPVPPDGPESVPGGTVVDGRLVTAGSHVLMRRPRELNEVHIQHLRKRAMQSRMGPNQSFKNEARKHGVKTVDKSKFTSGPLAAGSVDPEDEEDY